jgi:uncharacterized protein (TIGR03086 family)
MSEPTLDLLHIALDQAGTVVSAVRAEQLALPTPCAQWDVRALLLHVVKSDLGNFAVAARGDAADWGAQPGELGDDWAAEFHKGAKEVSEAWASADCDQLVPQHVGGTAPLRSRADQQIAELAIHAWDLARATGQSVDLSPEVAEHGLAWARPMLRAEYRGSDKAFGDEVPVPDDAPAYERLAGWFGRDPSWQGAALAR